MKITLAKKLRKNMTEAEKLLWAHLRRKGFLGSKFRRQHPLGPFVVDFVCLEHKFIIEVDGGQHGSNLEYDSQRTQWLESKGFKVFRVWNHQVLKETTAVLEKIYQELFPLLNPPPKNGGGEDANERNRKGV